MINFLKVLVAVALVVGTSLFAYQYFSKTENNEEVACTMEAKLCPDGSYVGRTGPECEFAACPSSEDSSWKVSANDQVTFSYPVALSKSYISTVDWPPTVNVLDEDFSCIEAGEETDTAGVTTKEKINGRDYCVTKESEGAAGNTYTNYAYAFWKEGKTIILTFSLRQPRCENYPEPQSTACSNEQENFDLNGMVDKIATSLELKD